jgi:hypothetical protein
MMPRAIADLDLWGRSRSAAPCSRFCPEEAVDFGAPQWTRMRVPTSSKSRHSVLPHATAPPSNPCPLRSNSRARIIRWLVPTTSDATCRLRRRGARPSLPPLSLESPSARTRLEMMSRRTRSDRPRPRCDHGPATTPPLRRGSCSTVRPVRCDGPRRHARPDQGNDRTAVGNGLRSQSQFQTQCGRVRTWRASRGARVAARILDIVELRIAEENRITDSRIIKHEPGDATQSD